MDSFTIGQLAHDGGVNIETVRYYERRGLLRQPPRPVSGYRQYSVTDLWRLQFIARAKHLGFTLTEIASLIGDHERCDTAESVLALARAKIREIDERQRSLVDTRSRLMRLVSICEDPESKDCTALRVTG
jgi:MerR family mercuric resistance operon transcriptional regulator